MTTQLTVRGVDDQLCGALETEARVRGLSLNQCIIALLRQATGIGGNGGQHPIVYGDLDALAGTWSDDQAAEFERALDEQRTIDAAPWP